MIPKNIFQTWKTSHVPDKWKEAQMSVIEKNPDYIYKLFTDDDNINIVTHYFPDFLETYTQLKQNIQRADAIRYMYMYIWGGIYLDLDYVALRSFDEIHLHKPVGLINTNNFRKTTTNSFLMSKPRQGIWLRCLKEIKIPSPWWIRWSPGLDVLHTTGPNMLHKVYIQQPNDVEKLSNIVSPCDVCQLYVSHKQSCQLPEETSPFILYQIPGASWNDYDMKIMNALYCYRYHILIIYLLVVFIPLIILMCIYMKDIKIR